MNQASKTKEWTGKVLQNIEHGGGYHVMTLSLPRSFNPCEGGQFVMLSAMNEPEILLRRPMAIYDLVRTQSEVQMNILYATVGRGTRAMAALPNNSEVSMFGPLGNFFDKPKQSECIYIVAGGIGVAPFLYWARTLSEKQRERCMFLFGFKDHAQLNIVKDFKKIGVAPITAIEGGGGDFEGTVVDLLEEQLQKNVPARILTCGPDAMMNRVLDISALKKIPCDVSLEAKMACGMGVCLSCVTTSNRLVCQEGPIFRH